LDKEDDVITDFKACVSGKRKKGQEKAKRETQFLIGSSLQERREKKSTLKGALAAAECVSH